MEWVRPLYQLGQDQPPHLVCPGGRALAQRRDLLTDRVERLALHFIALCVRCGQRGVRLGARLGDSLFGLGVRVRPGPGDRRLADKNGYVYSKYSR